MPWKQYKNSMFHIPSHEEIIIIAASTVICLLIVAYFIFTS